MIFFYSISKSDALAMWALQTALPVKTIAPERKLWHV
jgi:hypothetical protein